MNDLSSLYWIARCDGCGKPITAHAMSVLREAMLCLDCLDAESEAIAEQRGTGHTVMFASDVTTRFHLAKVAAPTTLALKLLHR